MDPDDPARHRRFWRTGGASRLIVVGAMAAAIVTTAVVGVRVADAETGTGAAGAGALAEPAPCIDTTVEASVEEARLDTPVPDQETPIGLEIVRRGGLGAHVEDFGRALCEVVDVAEAEA